MSRTAALWLPAALSFGLLACSNPAPASETEQGRRVVETITDGYLAGPELIGLTADERGCMAAAIVDSAGLDVFEGGDMPGLLGLSTAERAALVEQFFACADFGTWLLTDESATAYASAEQVRCVEEEVEGSGSLAELISYSLGVETSSGFLADLPDSDQFDWEGYFEELDTLVSGCGVGQSAAQGEEYGDNPELDALWDRCEIGDMEACDSLFTASAAGSEYSRFGDSCGNRAEHGSGEWCSSTPVTAPTGDTYGDNPELDALWDACSDGDMEACDELYYVSPPGSGYETFGDTCGGSAPAGTERWCSQESSVA